jgi:hypothetical protein
MIPLRRVRGVIVAFIIIREPQLLLHHRGLDLLIDLALAIVVIGCHSLEKRESREGESDRLDERE